MNFFPSSSECGPLSAKFGHPGSRNHVINMLVEQRSVFEVWTLSCLRFVYLLKKQTGSSRYDRLQQTSRKLPDRGLYDHMQGLGSRLASFGRAKFLKTSHDSPEVLILLILYNREMCIIIHDRPCGDRQGEPLHERYVAEGALLRGAARGVH